MSPESKPPETTRPHTIPVIGLLAAGVLGLVVLGIVWWHQPAGQTLAGSAGTAPTPVHQDPLWAWLFVAAVGVIFSVGTVVVARRIWRDHQRLQAQVHERTSTLQDERARLASIIHAMDAGTWEWHVQTGEIICNERWAGIVGYELAELAPVTIETWTRLLDPADGAEVARRLETHFAGRTDTYDCDCRLRHKDGSWVWIHTRGRLEERSPDGAPLIVRGIHIDISERKRAEAQLQQAHDVMRFIPVGLHIYHLDKVEDDRTLRMVFVNPASEQLSGFKASDLVGRTLDESFPQLRAMQVPQRYAEVVRSGQPRTFEDIHHDDAQEVRACFMVKAFPLPGNHVGVAFDNITERITAKQTLEASHVRLQEAQEIGNVGSWEYDLVTGVLTWSEQTYRIYGESPEHFTPTFESVVAFYPEGDRQAVLAAFHQALDDKAGLSIDHRIITRSGVQRQVEEIGRLVCSADGKPLRMIGSVADITQQRAAAAALAEQEKRLRQLVDGLDAGVVIIDPDTRTIESVNPYAARLFGAEPEQISGHVCHRFLCPAEVGKCPVLDCGGEVENSQRVLLTADGRRVPILKSVRRITISGKEKLLETFVDISAQQQTEQRLLLTNLELERQTAIANDLAAKAEMASAAKSAFLANMSHEIRTPMNGILGMTELLLGTALSAEQEDYARTAYGSAESLLILLNDILDFSKIDASKLSLESIPFAPDASLYEIVELFRPRISGSGVELLVRTGPGLPPRFLGDPGRWRQILTNLVGNAIKFTPKGHVLIDLSWREGELVLAVSDTGIGIPPDRAAVLFAPFVQADESTSRRFGGTGLGLAISRRLAELMGGRLGLDSTEGHGSTFTVSVPLPLAPGPAPTAAAPQGLAGLRILVLDDNALNCRIVCEQLTVLGARPEAETCAPLALATLCSAAAGPDPFAAAIVDLHMPDLDGVSLATAVLADPGTSSLPLILLSSSGTKGDAQHMAAVGFAGYLVKPARLEVLGSVVATAIAHRRQGLRDLVTRHSVREAAGQSAAPILNRFAGRVLLVEDNPVNQKLGRIMLGHLGVSVTLAENGQQALEILAAQTFDLVFMDCQMPIMDGYEATAALRARESRQALPRLPVIAMTANALAGDREKSLASGMDDHIAKPVQERQLAEVLRRWLAGATPVEPHRHP